MACCHFLTSRAVGKLFINKIELLSFLQRYFSAAVLGVKLVMMNSFAGISISQSSMQTQHRPHTDLYLAIDEVPA